MKNGDQGNEGNLDKEIVAESDNAIINEDYYYFLIDAVHVDLLKPSRDKTNNYLKETAIDFHVKIGWKKLSNGA